MQRTIYFGPPGTGKTTTLLSRLEEHLSNGVPPERIAFLTFTRRAKREALERVESALGVKPKNLPYFRTIHSMAFRGLALKEGDVMGRAEFAKFGASMGLKFGTSAATEFASEGITSKEMGDALLALDTLARVRGATLRTTWQDARSDIEWPVVKHFSESYELFRRESALLDFTDVLLEFVRSDVTLPVDVAFIDEAQDLSALQWLASLKATQGAATQYVAGDDDQAIYAWAGADVRSFIELEGERVILAESFRLPRRIHNLAQRVVRGVKGRVEKEFRPRDEDGAVLRHASADALDLSDGAPWLWLVRNRYLLNALRDRLLHKGVVYSEHGATSVVASERDAIYNWERLRAGRAITAVEARDMYALLRTKTQVARGHKLIPSAPDDALLTLAALREHHGLLADGTWFEVFRSIPVLRSAYYRKLLRQHGTLRLSPQVQLETIHGAKGAECGNVALFLEQSRRTWEEQQRKPDDEHRVWYVAVTRARCALHVIEGGGRYAYTLPAVSG